VLPPLPPPVSPLPEDDEPPSPDEVPVLSLDEPPPSPDEELPLFEEDKDDELPDEEPPDVDEPNVANAPVILVTVLVTFVPTADEVVPLTTPAFPAQGFEPGGDAALIEATQAS